ncbi:MAG: CoB--CoM heterodisulfide reductase iron-sulfur subunit A family protein [Pseudomonadota bacterium]
MRRPETGVLVLGGGIAGMQAAIDLGNMGFRVYLLERSPSIGGRMAQLDKTFPTNDCAICILAPKMRECFDHPQVTTLTYAEMVGLSGQMGEFKALVRLKPRYVDLDKCTGCGECLAKCPVKVPNDFNMGLDKRKAIYMPFMQAVPKKMTIDAARCMQLTRGKCGNCKKVCQAGAIDYDQKERTTELNVAAVVLSTGFDVYDVSALSQYGYGRIKNVITAMEFERLICASGPTHGHLTRPSDHAIPESVAFIQCAGSRNLKHKPYCSSVCCMHATKEAILASEHYPDLKPYIFHMDMRAVGKGFYKYVERAKTDYRVTYIRSRPGEIREDAQGNPVLWYEDTATGEVKNLTVGLVVLAQALLPSRGNQEISDIVGVPLDEYGFFKRADKLLRPVDTVREGVFACGFCQSPQDIPDSVTQASGTAARVAEVLGEHVGKKKVGTAW